MSRKTGSERRDTNKRDPIAELETKIARIKKQLQTSGSRGKGSQVTLLRTLENRLTQYKQNKAQFGNVWGNRRNESPTGRSVSKNKNNLKIDQNELKPNQYRLTEWTTDQEADEEGKIVEEGPIPTIDNEIVEEKEEENQNWVQTPSPTWGMTDTDRVNKANVQIAINAANQNKKISEIGGKEYVTDYQTAVRNAGGPWGDVEQYYGEDVLDSAGNRVRKSNVFTLDEDGNPMGVKTRRQRLAEDLKRQEAQNKAKPNLVQTPSPTWTVDQNKQPESTKVNVQESSVPSGTSFKPVALSPEYADSIFFDPENFAK